MRPLRIQGSICVDGKSSIGSIGCTRAVRLRIPSYKGISTLLKAITQYSDCIPRIIGAFSVCHRSGSAVGIVGHGAALRPRRQVDAACSVCMMAVCKPIYRAAVDDPILRSVTEYHARVARIVRMDVSNILLVGIDCNFSIV